MWSTPPLSRCSWTLRRPLGAPFRSAIDDRINRFLDRQAGRLGDLQPDIGPLLALTGRLLAGGKRLRPAFCAGGTWPPPGRRTTSPLDVVLAAAASLELLHASALVHDDVMDGSDTRRGDPSAHRQLESLHRADGRARRSRDLRPGRGDPAR